MPSQGKRAARQNKSYFTIAHTSYRATERPLEEEVQVACFSAGFQRRDPFTFILFVLLQFHVGIRMTPITEARTGFFDPAKAMAAVRRGAAMNVDLTNGWDYWPVIGEQVEELRRRYNILPAEVFLSANRNATSTVEEKTETF